MFQFWNKKWIEALISNRCFIFLIIHEHWSTYNQLLPRRASSFRWTSEASSENILCLLGTVTILIEKSALYLARILSTASQWSLQQIRNLRGSLVKLYCSIFTWGYKHAFFHMCFCVYEMPIFGFVNSYRATGLFPMVGI